MISALFLYQLEFILRKTSKLAANAISKVLIVSKVFLKKFFELNLYYWVLNFKTMFMLMPLLNHQFAKKEDSKKDMIKLVDPNSFEIVFALVIKMIAIQI